MGSPRVLLAFLTLAFPFGTFGAAAEAGPRVRIAQEEVRIPSEAQIDRMERDAISTPPLDVSEGRQTGSEAAEIRQMDRRARSIDEKLLKDGDVCRGC
ncbi:hypothetical protein ACWFZ6_23875 [Methylorubrum extorquens]|uniref:hypothetical protein n=1 Tax=Methylorubrum extorquens TaxID=408 RepID=UPI003F64849E